MGFGFWKGPVKHKTSNQEQKYESSFFTPLEIQVSLPEVANNWKHGRDGSVWLAPAMSSCLECPYLGSTQLHPLIPSHRPDAVRTINLPGWVPCHVLTANTPHPPSPPSPSTKVESHATHIDSDVPQAQRDYGQISDDCEKHLMYSMHISTPFNTVSLIFLGGGSNKELQCVFRSVV